MVIIAKEENVRGSFQGRTQKAYPFFVETFQSNVTQTSSISEQGDVINVREILHVYCSQVQLTPNSLVYSNPKPFTKNLKKTKKGVVALQATEYCSVIRGLCLIYER